MPLLARCQPWIFPALEKFAPSLKFDYFDEAICRKAKSVSGLKSLKIRYQMNIGLCNREFVTKKLQLSVSAYSKNVKRNVIYSVDCLNGINLYCVSLNSLMLN